MNAAADPQPAAGAGAVLGFDVGSRLIGVAVGNRLLGTTRALGTVAVHGDDPDWPRLDALVRDWQPEAFAVGLPLTEEGAEQPMTRRARRFAARIVARYALPAHAVDERYSSREAARRFAAARAAGTLRRKHAETIDALAAAVILETWFGTTR
jgi:putative Holliday junction resolvase